MRKLFKEANIYPISSEKFVGDILIEDGKIKDIGEDLKYENAEIIECKGKYIFPGFIDAHSHLGLMEEALGESFQDVNEMTKPDTAQVRVIDAFNPDYDQIKEALSGGVTTVMVVPGSANPVGGQGAIFKLRSNMIEEMLIREPAGLKMALGENPKRVYGAKATLPMTRLGNAAFIRQYFTDVNAYMRKKAETTNENKPFFDIKLNLEIGEKVLKKEIPARIHAHRKDDIITAIRLSEEFDFDLVIEHATDSYKIPDYIKEKNIPIVLGPLMGFKTKPEVRDKTFAALRIMSEAGCEPALMCDHPVIPQELASIQAGIGLKEGAREEELLKMLTINPAKILKLEDKIGTLEKGKDADIVIWSEHPFNLSATVKGTYIEGKLVYSK